MKHKNRIRARVTLGRRSDILSRYYNTNENLCEKRKRQNQPTNGQNETLRQTKSDV